MSDLHKYKINLSDGQKEKLKFAFKKRKSVVIGLSNDQLQGGKSSILLTNEQYKLVKKALNNSKGLRLNINYEQLLKSKEGGLLNEILEFVEENIPYAKKFTPIIRNNAESVFEEYVIPWLTSEFKKLRKKSGSGLDIQTFNAIRSDLIKAAQKKVSR